MSLQVTKHRIRQVEETGLYIIDSWDTQIKRWILNTAGKEFRNLGLAMTFVWFDRERPLILEVTEE